MSEHLSLLVPSITGKPLVLELRSVYEIEARIHEVAGLTRGKAPELMSTFNKTYGKLHDLVFDLNLEKILAERKLSEIKSVVILDQVPQILKERGLANNRSPLGSEDLREAILAQNSDYQNTLVIVKQIECAIELLNGKMRSIQMAYQSVKKVYEDNSFLNKDINEPIEERHNSGFSDKVRY